MSFPKAAAPLLISNKQDKSYSCTSGFLSKIIKTGGGTIKRLICNSLFSTQCFQVELHTVLDTSL